MSTAHAPPESSFLPLAEPLRLVRSVLPLWRYVVWSVALFSVMAASVVVRLDVQQVRKDLHRNDRAQREARILNDRLRLELDARRRAVAMEAVATEFAMGTEARVVRVGGVR